VGVKNDAKRKYRHKDAVVVKHDGREKLLEHLKEIVIRGETINSVGNLIAKNAGFAVYRPAEVHIFGEDLTEEEIKEVMDEVDKVIREVKAKQCYRKEQQPSDKS